MAESRQESFTSDGVVKVTRKKRYRLGIEKVSLKGLRQNYVIYLFDVIMFFDVELRYVLIFLNYAWK